MNRFIRAEILAVDAVIENANVRCVRAGMLLDEKPFVVLRNCHRKPCRVDLCCKKHAINRIAEDDVIVSTCIRYFSMGGITWEETMERCVIALAESRIAILKELTRMKKLLVEPIRITPNDIDRNADV